MKSKLAVFIILLIIFVCPTAATAQVSINGSLSGRVVDPSGAAVAGASVTLTNAQNGQQQTATTGDDGVYNFPRLAAGVYSLRIERQGFSAAQTENVRVFVNEAAVANIALQIGEVSATVKVEADEQITQTQNTNVSQIIETREVADLPLNSKDFQKLTFLAPGVGGQRGNNPSTNFSVSGARETGNNYVVDGVSANDERSTAGLAPPGFGQVVPNVISTEAIQEFRIITSNADATFGRGSGGQINVVTKSGTNRFSGSLYEYFRNDALDARDFFNYGPFFNRDGTPRTPPFKQHLFGGTIGGRIFLPGFGEGTPAFLDRRDKDFFFFSYEGFRQKRQETGSLELPNADLINLFRGDFGRLARAFYFDGGAVPTSGNRPGQFFPLSPANRSAAIAGGFNPLLFDGNPANGEAGTVLVSNASRRDFDQNTLLVRTDHNFTDKFTGAFRFARSKNDFIRNTAGLSITETNSPTGVKSGAAQFIYAFSPTQILEVRGGLLNSKFLQAARIGEFNPTLAALGVSPDFGIGVTASGTTFRMPSIFPAFDFSSDDYTAQVAALYTLSRGNVTYRAGLDVRRIYIDFTNSNFARPAFAFTGIVGRTGLIGASPSQTDAIVASATATIFGRDPQNPNNIVGPTTPLRRYRSTEQEYFLQTDWRARPNLTLNLGVRYSYFGVYSEADSAFGNLYARNPQTGEIVPDVSPFAFGRTANVIAPLADDRPLYQPDRNNFQPRVGAAYDIFGNGKTVLRAAYGLYFDRFTQLSFSNQTNNPPFAFAGSISTTPTNEAARIFRLGQTTNLNPQATPVIFAIDPTIENPETHRFSFAVEQEIDRNTSVNVAYVGLRARKLVRTIDPNFAGAFPQSARPDTRFSDQRILISGSSSEYDSLQIYARRRLSNFGSFTASYTLGRLTDDTSVDTIFSVNPTNVNLGANPNVSGIQTGAIGDRPFDVDRGNSELDLRHNLVVSHVFEVPFGRGRRFFSNADGFLNALIGGFEITGIGVFRSGARFNVTTGTDDNEDGSFNDRPALSSGDLNDLYASGGDPTQVLLNAADARLRLGRPSDVTNPFLQIPRNAFRAPNVRFYDVSIIKRFRFTETVGLQLEANIFNITNTPNFAAPVSVLSSPLFGRTTATAAVTNPRQVQLGAKLRF